MIRAVLFTDVVGSTAMRTSYGDAAVDRLLRAHDEVVESAVVSVGGTVVKGTGDGSIAVFDSARAAVEAAVAIQAAVADREIEADGPELEVRVGINAGEVNEERGDVLGEAVHAAARLLDHAGGGEVVVTRVVRDLVGTTDIGFVDLGPRELRGFPQPWELLAVDWDGTGHQPRLSVRLLGEATVARDDGMQVSGLMTPPVQRLVAQLALARGRPMARSTLAYTLWPDSSESQARTNLRKVLHALRRDLPRVIDHVEVDNQQVRWLVDGPNSVDLVAFLDAVDASDDATAASLYGGELLPECYDDWVLVERDRLRMDACTVLGRLTDRCASEGDDHSSLKHAGALLAIDPLAELAHRALIAAHWRMGNRASALRAYHRCVEVLDAELGVEPEGETRALHDQLRSADEDRPEPTPRGRVATPLLGRDDELEVLRQAWHDATERRARMALVTGEPGIGKSRLVQALVREVGSTALVVHARAYETAGRLPWGPVVEWLRSASLAPRISLLDSGWRRELATLLPELFDDPATRTGRPATDDMRRRQLFDAVAEAVLAEPGPVLLVIDDLQWCDADTIDLIGFLVSSRSDAPLLVLGTARSEEVDEIHPLTAVTQGLARLDSLTEVPLGPLAREATEDLYLQMTGGAMPSHADRLWADTVGNPLFVVEAARAGRGRDGPSMSKTMKATISTRLGRLSTSARQLVDVAATIGREFDVDSLLSTHGGAEADVLDALDELWHRQIIREQEGSYDFHHDRIREVAYDGISPVRRRRLHSAAADALVAASGPGAGPHSGDVAAHLDRAARFGEAVTSYTHAAHYALEVHSPDEIVKQCQRGLAVIGRLPPGGDRDERELELRLMVANYLGIREGLGSTAVQDGFERSLALARRLGREPDPSTLRGLAMAGIVFCDYAKATAFGRELALRDDPVSRCEGEYVLGVSEFWRGDMARSTTHLEAALECYDPPSGHIHRLFFAQDPYAICLVRLALTMLWRDEVERSLELVDRALDFSEEIDHPTTRCYVLAHAAMHSLELGHLDIARTRAADGVALADEHHLHTFARIIGCFEPWLDTVEGHDGAFDTLVATASAGSEGELSSLNYTFFESLVGRAALVTGDQIRGLEAVRAGIEWGRSHDQRYAEPLLLRIEGELHAQRGVNDGARRALAEAVDLAGVQGADRLVRLAQETASRLDLD